MYGRTMTRRQELNLKRGGVRADAVSAALARAGKTAIRARDDELAATAGRDPWGAYEELHATMTRHITRLLRDEERSGHKPSRELTDRLREYRVTTQALSEYRSMHAVDEETKAFFATLGERMESFAKSVTCPNCQEHVDVVKPVIDLPVD
jgi:hypothetical protein